jgi:ribonuclease VapC
MERMTYILDASAIIALLEGERGADVVAAKMSRAKISAVNVAEVVSIYSHRGVNDAQIIAMLAPLRLDIVAADAALGYRAGLLRTATVTSGLSLGDRFCLALAEREGATALTADRQWLDVVDQTGVSVELIR